MFEVIDVRGEVVEGQGGIVKASTLDYGGTIPGEGGQEEENRRERGRERRRETDIAGGDGVYKLSRDGGAGETVRTRSS